MAARIRKAYKDAKQRKFEKVMHEYHSGTLHSGRGGPVVRNRRQAIAIAFSEARKRGRG